MKIIKAIGKALKKVCLVEKKSQNIDKERKRTNLIYEPIERYKVYAFRKIYEIEYTLKRMLENIAVNPNNIPNFNVYIAIRQMGGKSYLFKKKGDSEECEIINFMITISELDHSKSSYNRDNSSSHSAFENLYDNEYHHSASLLEDKISSILSCDIDNLFIHRIYPNYMDMSISNIEYLAFIIIETEGYQKYQNLLSFYERLALSCEELVAFDKKYSVPIAENIIDETVKDIYLGVNSLSLYSHVNLPSFSLITELSSMLYEGGMYRARIIIDDNRKSEDKALSVTFIKPIKMNTKNLRAVRKILEIVNYNADSFASGQALLANTYSEDGDPFIRFKIVGIVKFEDYVNSPSFIIEDHLAWRYVRNKETLLFYRNGRYIVRKNEEFDKDLLFEKLSKTFTADKASDLRKVINVAWEQKHGTTVLVTDEAKSEILKLCDYERGYQIEEIDLSKNEDLIISLTAIDGALVIDTNCFCYAIGVILDGNTVIKGSMARGARYNSAKNYIGILKAKDIHAIAVIISEDRTMDIISTQDFVNSGG